MAYNKILLKNISYIDEYFEIKSANILIEGEKISKIFYNLPNKDNCGNSISNSEIVLDLNGYLALPGFINAHDHLIESFITDSIFQMYEKKYLSWYEWEQEFKNSLHFKLLQSLSVADLYTLGMYKNVLSGVTLIVDHSPRDVRAPFVNKPLISLLEHFFLSHSVSSCAPKWGLGIVEEYQLSLGIIPFVIHAAEGLKPECREEIETLSRLGVLGKNTVIVNPVGITESEIKNISSRGASIIWCPNCCKNIYGVQPQLSEIIKNNINLAIGSDKAQVNPKFFFDDIKLAYEILRNLLVDWDKQNILELVLKMVTIIPAKIFNIHNEFGLIKENYFANLVIVENITNSLEVLLDLEPTNVSLLFHKGTVVFGDDKFRIAIAREIGNYSEIYIDKKPKIIFGRPFQCIQRIKEKLDLDFVIPFMPISTLEKVNL